MTKRGVTGGERQSVWHLSDNLLPEQNLVAAQRGCGGAAAEANERTKRSFRRCGRGSIVLHYNVAFPRHRG
jgi:hypothetical protein